MSTYAKQDTPLPLDLKRCNQVANSQYGNVWICTKWDHSEQPDEHWFIRVQTK